uniref:protein-tyrosine-phosphatase n=1 Tax=uncultured bacterium fosmid pJB71G8 TaxID=1478068 RepID=A0A0H3U9S6_9BACT|nr:hypothetical protein [uncultured bacterium fosmid pJB71G8]
MFNFLRKRPKNSTLFYNTDVHCHILPGVDHGAQTVEQSLEMLEAQMGMGINRVICTSHVTSETFENTPESLTQAYNILCDAVKQAGMDIELHCSAEYRIDEYWDKQYEAGNIIPMPGKFILMENSFQQELLLLDDLMFDLMVKGYKPILAHPERYFYYAKRHDRLMKLHGSGVKFQVNILSLAGFFGHGARETALWLIKNGLVDMLGTDMHNMNHAEVIKEYIGSKEWTKLARVLEPNIINDWVK